MHSPSVPFSAKASKEFPLVIILLLGSFARMASLNVFGTLQCNNGQAPGEISKPNGAESKNLNVTQTCLKKPSSICSLARRPTALRISARNASFP